MPLNSKKLIDDLKKQMQEISYAGWMRSSEIGTGVFFRRTRSEPLIEIDRTLALFFQATPNFNELPTTIEEMKQYAIALISFKSAAQAVRDAIIDWKNSKAYPEDSFRINSVSSLNQVIQNTLILLQRNLYHLAYNLLIKHEHAKRQNFFQLVKVLENNIATYKTLEEKIHTTEQLLILHKNELIRMQKTGIYDKGNDNLTKLLIGEIDLQIKQVSDYQNKLRTLSEENEKLSSFKNIPPKNKPEKTKRKKFVTFKPDNELTEIKEFYQDEIIKPAKNISKKN